MPPLRCLWCDWFLDGRRKLILQATFRWIFNIMHIALSFQCRPTVPVSKMVTFYLLKLRIKHKTHAKKKKNYRGKICKLNFLKVWRCCWLWEKRLFSCISTEQKNNIRQWSGWAQSRVAHCFGSPPNGDHGLLGSIDRHVCVCLFVLGTPLRRRPVTRLNWA